VHQPVRRLVFCEGRLGYGVKYLGTLGEQDIMSVTGTNVYTCSCYLVLLKLPSVYGAN
jgi:hypothetical protein